MHKTCTTYLQDGQYAGDRPITALGSADLCLWNAEFGHSLAWLGLPEAACSPLFHFQYTE